MRAFGKGSIAEIIRIGLLIGWAVLWVCMATILAISIAFALHSAGIVDMGKFFAPDNGIRLNFGEDEISLPAGAPTWPLFISAILVGAVVVGGGLMIVWRLRRLVESFCSGQPFAKPNATHLRAIWMTMVGIEVARYALLLLTIAALTGFGATQDADLKLKIDLSTWGSILILIVLAEVFREGARLKEEQELTI
ncbi:DUF2975 domain-containing protein [Terricaulis sp.]|uniref:DUF2975 domain-containing protein n=1 Tax=Terricaulis sp. TaxID=2768686 RepID=UPI003784B353